MPSKPSVEAEQTELNLKVAEPTPQPESTEVTPTPLLEAVAKEIKKINQTLKLEYSTNGENAILMEVFHGISYIGSFEDKQGELWNFNTSKMLFHGFTREQLDAISEIELPKS